MERKYALVNLSIVVLIVAPVIFIQSVEAKCSKSDETAVKCYIVNPNQPKSNIKVANNVKFADVIYNVAKYYDESGSSCATPTNSNQKQQQSSNGKQPTEITRFLNEKVTRSGADAAKMYPLRDAKDSNETRLKLTDSSCVFVKVDTCRTASTGFALDCSKVLRVSTV